MSKHNINVHLPGITSRRRLSKVPRSKIELKTIVRKVVGHKCKLPIGEDQIHYVIKDGCFVLLRRKLRKWLTVSPNSPESMRYLKSSARIEREQMRHLSKYFYMIHPFSNGRFVWEMVMIPVFMMAFYIIPMQVAVPIGPLHRVYRELVVDIFCFVDIILYFVTGYYDYDKQKVELDFNKVAKRYASRLFFFDVISSLPLSYYSYLTDGGDLRLYKTILLTKLVRMPTLAQYLYKFSERMNFMRYYMRFANFIIWIVVLINWAACILFCITTFRKKIDYNKGEEPYVIQENELVPLIMTSWDVVLAFMTIGVGEIQNISRWVMAFDTLCLLFGSALNIVILAKVMQMFQNQSSSNNKYTGLLNEIHEYMKYKELPTRLRDKIIKYVDFKFQKHIFREEEILNTLSSVLKQEILLHTCQTMVEKVDFFKDFPTHVMLRIVKKLRSEIYLANDIIVLAGYAGNAMYFIYTGTVAVYTSTGKEICHLEDGDHFGEIALVINEPRVATVVAVKDCELFKLNRKEFQEAIDPFPELSNKVRLLAMKRLETTRKITEQTTPSEEHVIEDDANEDTEEDKISSMYTFDEYRLEKDKDDDI